MKDFKQLNNEYKKVEATKTIEEGNQILVDTLEQYSGVAGWYLDLRTMGFTALSKRIYEIYGIPEGNVDYRKFLTDYIPIEDQQIVEKVRLRLLSGESPIECDHRIIQQSTGDILQLRSCCYVIEEDGEITGIRGITYAI